MIPRRISALALAAAATVAGAGSVAFAAPQADPLRPLRAAAPPVIDGSLDEAIWQQAPSVTGFKTWTPDYGIDMLDQTTAYYAYDAKNLYFAFRALDREPSKIKATMANRDSVIPDDWICINLDSFGDQQSLYALYVNPLGIQADSRFAAGREDFGFDAVWYSAGRIDEQGYTVEVRIPFKSIRYRGGNPVTMGVIFERRVSRRSENGTFPPLDPKAGLNFTIQMTPIVFDGIEHYTLFEVLPSVTYSRSDTAPLGRLTRASSGGDLGVTAKYGITADLMLDGALNPDFSQVEADAGQIDINLRAPLFFAEKRPFFLEGQEVFNLGGPDGTLQSIVHTRTIVNPLGGVKLSGKVSRADTVAAVYALDERPGTPPAIHPAQDDAHVGILRYKRSLSQDSYLGAFFTAREQGEHFNRVGGADGSVRLNPSAHIGFYAFGSTSRPNEVEASSEGHAIGASFTHTTRNLGLSFSGSDIGKDFATETGYLARSGVTMLSASATPHFYPKKGLVRRVDLITGTMQTRDTFSGMWETENSGGLRLVMQRSASLTMSYRHSSEVFLDEEFGTSAISVSGSIQLTRQLRTQGSFSRSGAIYYSADPFGGTATRAGLTVTYEPAESWSESLSLTYADFERTSDRTLLYDYTILRSRTTFQPNRYLLFRGILEYNSFRRQLLTDFLGSFTYIPGTVIHGGYGSLYERTRWEGSRYVPDNRFFETRRGLFFKASYLWRL